MKKYNKPTLNIEELNLINDIAAILSGVTNIGLTQDGDKEINFEDFWGNN